MKTYWKVSGYVRIWCTQCPIWFEVNKSACNEWRSRPTLLGIGKPRFYSCNTQHGWHVSWTFNFYPFYSICFQSQSCSEIENTLVPGMFPQCRAKLHPLCRAKLDPLCRAKLHPLCRAKLHPLCRAKLDPLCGAELHPLCRAKLHPLCGAKLHPLCGAKLHPLCGAKLYPLCGAKLHPLCRAKLHAGNL